MDAMLPFPILAYPTLGFPPVGDECIQNAAVPKRSDREGLKRRSRVNGPIATEIRALSQFREPQGRFCRDSGASGAQQKRLLKTDT